jgi:hypothetical protein
MEEKRIQQIIDSTIKVLISMVTLRPILRSLFSFKGALSIIIAISILRILDSLTRYVGSPNVFELIAIPSEIVSMIYTFINILYYAALIAAFVLLRRLLASHQNDEADRALALALKQGLITEHEFEQKRLMAQKMRFAYILSSIEQAGVLTPNTREQMSKIVDESYKRWILKEALLQALTSGAIDDTFYTKRINDLGLQ